MKSKLIGLIVGILIITIFLGTNNIAYASEKIEIAASSEGTNRYEGQTIDETIRGADDFIHGADVNEALDQDYIKDSVGDIYNIFLAIGIVIAVIWGIVIGIIFMMGSAEGKAEMKESLLSYVIGCVIIFGAFGIWKIVIILMEGFG